MFLNAIGKTSFPSQNKDERRLIDAVLFSIWARGRKAQGRLRIVLQVFMSWIVSTILFVVTLPMRIVRRIPEILVSLLIAYAISYSFDIIVTEQRLVLAAAIFLVICREPIIQALRHIAFDIGDILLFGSLTKRYINRWESLGPIQEHDDQDFREYIYTSRILLSGDDHEEAEAAQFYFSEPERSSRERKKAIDRYWSEYPSNRRFWRDLAGWSLSLEEDRQKREEDARSLMNEVLGPEFSALEFDPSDSSLVQAVLAFLWGLLSDMVEYDVRKRMLVDYLTKEFDYSLVDARAEVRIAEKRYNTADDRFDEIAELGKKTYYDRKVGRLAAYWMRDT